MEEVTGVGKEDTRGVGGRQDNLCRVREQGKNVRVPQVGRKAGRTRGSSDGRATGRKLSERDTPGRKPNGKNGSWREGIARRAKGTTRDMDPEVLPGGGHGGGPEGGAKQGMMPEGKRVCGNNRSF